MLSKLLLGASQKLTERVVAAVTLPALGFWFVGIAVLYLSPAYTAVAEHIKGAGVPLLAIWAATLLGAIVVSAGLVSWLQPQVSKLLLGEWPQWLHRLQAWLASRKLSAYEKKSNEWQSLARKINAVKWDSLTAEEVRTYQDLERTLRGWPSDYRQVMPTKLGNLLRAAASRIVGKYGLEVGIVWARLELVVPASPRQLLSQTQSEFQAAANATTWSAILPLWVIVGFVWGASGWHLWMIVALIPVSVGLTVAAYQRCVLSLEQFGETFEAIFDLFRTDLYRALRFPLPSTPEEELLTGGTVTAYLLRGSHSSQFHFAASTGTGSDDGKHAKDEIEAASNLPGGEHSASSKSSEDHAKPEPEEGEDRESEPDSDEDEASAEEKSDSD
jgi:hypothetical protein